MVVRSRATVGLGRAGVEVIQAAEESRVFGEDTVMCGNGHDVGIVRTGGRNPISDEVVCDEGGE